MSYLKPQVSFSLNFASLFSVMEMSLLCFFKWNFIWFLQKEPHHSAKFQTFDCSGEFSPNLYFDWLLLLKVYKVSAKTSMEEICLMIQKSGAKFEEKLIFCSKNDKNLVNFDPSTKKSKKRMHFDWSLLCKVCNVWLKKVQRIYISWNWKVMQNLKRNRLVVWRMTRNLANFHHNTWKCQN